MTNQGSNDPRSNSKEVTEAATSGEDENRLIAERRQKLSAARTGPGNGFSNTFRRSHLCHQLQTEYGEKEKPALEALSIPVTVAGRLMRNRGSFLVIQDVSGQIQLYINRKSLSSEQLELIKGFDLGDIIGASGQLQKSNKGDLFVDIAQAELITKALRPLPDKFKGLADTETRYRRRYLDLLVNEQSRRTFEIRSKVISGVRNYLADRAFIEVETPMLQVIPGGATARPFKTHHNALDIDMYLRIAPELYLKRLIVGGMERVFEINRNFRNEGLSTRHNPEFTMIEFYQAFADYRDLMDLTEDMLRHIATTVLGSPVFTNTVRGADGEVTETIEFDFSRPFERLSVVQAIVRYADDISEADIADESSARAVCERLRLKTMPSWGLGKLQIEIFDAVAEHRLIQPTFITEYPTEVSPLARRNDDNPFITDRFEFFVGGRELANGFSELNDPEDQAERFKAQVAEKEAGDDEAMFYDDEYIRALEHGMPPTAGEGIGIDRLIMLLADAPSIRDVIMFPHMRPAAQ